MRVTYRVRGLPLLESGWKLKQISKKERKGKKSLSRHYLKAISKGLFLEDPVRKLNPFHFWLCCMFPGCDVCGSALLASGPETWSHHCHQVTGATTKKPQVEHTAHLFASSLSSLSHCVHVIAIWLCDLFLYCREVQYIVLQNIATMSIQRKVSQLLDVRTVKVLCSDAGCVFIYLSYVQTGDVWTLHEELLCPVYRCHTYQNTKGTCHFTFVYIIVYSLRHYGLKWGSVRFIACEVAVINHFIILCKPAKSISSCRVKFVQTSLDINGVVTPKNSFRKHLNSGSMQKIVWNSVLTQCDTHCSLTLRLEVGILLLIKSQCYNNKM